MTDEGAKVSFIELSQGICLLLNNSFNYFFSFFFSSKYMLIYFLNDRMNLIE